MAALQASPPGSRKRGVRLPGGSGRVAFMLLPRGAVNRIVAPACSRRFPLEGDSFTSCGAGATSLTNCLPFGRFDSKPVCTSATASGLFNDPPEEGSQLLGQPAAATKLDPANSLVTTGGSFSMNTPYSSTKKPGVNPESKNAGTKQ